MPEPFAARWGEKRSSKILSQQIYPGKYFASVALIPTPVWFAVLAG